MTQIYGHKWLSSFGDHDSGGTWLLGLGDLEPKDLATGLRACIDRQDPWPPSLPEFKALCLNRPIDSVLITQAVHGGGGEIGRKIRQQIGSWDMSHNTEQQLSRQAAAVLPEIIRIESAERSLAALTQQPEGDLSEIIYNRVILKKKGG